MNFKQQKTYWKRAAEHHLQIGHSDAAQHFSTFEPSKVLKELNNMLYPALMFERPEERLADGHSDNIRLNSSGAILVIKKAAKDDQVDIDAAFDECYDIAHDMVAKMLNDRKKSNQSGVTEPESLLKELDLATVSIREVGPVFDSCFGWRVDYTFNGVDSLFFDESKWLSGTETTFNYND